MKKILFLFILIFPCYCIAQLSSSSIKGTWQLDSVVTGSGVPLVGNVDYKLTFLDSTITYNKAGNSCSATYRIGLGDTLKTSGAGCTKMCCDEEVDSLSLYIKYEGKMWVKNNTLVIKNNFVSFYLHKL